jgi:hypothetical protein
VKLSLIYGAAMAIAGAALTLLLYLTGLHDSVERLSLAQWIGTAGGVAIGVTCLALSMRDKRARHPADAEWGYGSALGVGTLTGLWGSLFGMVTAYVYFGVINPGFSEVVYQAQVAGMEAKGVSAAQIEKLEPMLRKWMSPLVMTLIQGAMGFIWSFLLALIVAIFFRRRPEVSVPPTGEPPALA